jgi:hypothetical protein
MEEEGFRLGADSIVTVPLAGVTPGPDNTERGDDTTSDICYIGSDTSSDAGDIPNDTLSANEDSSHVPQRWAAFLKNTKQVVEAELRDMHDRHMRLFQHLVAQGCLHILFGADNTSRSTFVSEAEKAEQGVLKILFPHVPSCQQSPRLTIPQFLFEGPEDYSTLFKVLNRLRRVQGFPSKVQVSGSSEEPVHLDVVWHVGSDMKLVMILRGRALSGPFGCTVCKWHRKEGMWLDHDSTAISESQAVEWHDAYLAPIRAAEEAVSHAAKLTAKEEKERAGVAARQRLNTAFSVVRQAAPRDHALLQALQQPLVVQCMANRRLLPAKHIRKQAPEAVSSHCSALLSMVQACAKEQSKQKDQVAELDDRTQQMDIERAMDGNERVLAGLHLQESLRRLDELKAFRLELIRRINIEHKLCVVDLQGAACLCTPDLDLQSMSMQHLTTFLSTVLGGKKRKDMFRQVAGPYHCWVEVLHLRLNLVRTWFDHTRNILHVLFHPDATSRTMAGIRAAIKQPCKPARGTRPGETFSAAGLNLATLLYNEFKLYQPLQGFDGARANRLMVIMCSENLWEQGKLGPGLQKLLEDPGYAEFRPVLVNLRGVWKGLQAVCGAAGMSYGAHPDPLDTLDAAVQLFARHTVFFTNYPCKDQQSYPFRYDLKGYDHVCLKELVPQQKLLLSMGLSLAAVSSTCVEHQNTDLHAMGSKHNNGGEHLADNAHLAVVKTIIKLNAKNKVERAGLYAELAATLPDLSEHDADDTHE